MRLSVLIILWVLVPSLTFSQTIDKQKSVVNFKATAMGMFGVKGTFKGFTGKVKFQPKKLDQSMIDVCIDATTFKTGNDTRDSHVKAEEFLFVEKYPRVCFRSSSIQKSENGYVATGTLKLRGVQRKIKIPLTYENNVLKGSIELSRLEYNIGKEVSTIKAGDTIKIDIVCVLKP